MTHTPKEYSKEEIQQQFVNHLWALIAFWEHCPHCKCEHDKLTGLVHSILCVLDGASGSLPGFLVIPSPHEADKAYQIERGEDYYPPAIDATDEMCDIGGNLHELFCKATATAEG